MRARWVVLAAAAILSAGCGSSASPHPTFPIVPTRDGALLSPLDLVTIVSSSEGQDASTLFQFSSELAVSDWWKELANEYGLGPVTPAASITGLAITGDMTDHDVYEYVTAAVTANGGPSRNGNTLYLLYLPAGVALLQDGVRNTDCQKLGGYHARYGTEGDNLAVIQQCGGDNPIGSLTVTASHEVLEAATDPDGLGYALPPIAPHAPWNQSIWNAYELTGHAELADLCEGAYVLEGDFYYQRIWSNVQAAKGGDPCLPQLPDPYYDATFAADWYRIEAGQTLSIPMHGWSTAPVGSWPVKVSVASAVMGFSAVPAAGSLSAGEASNLTVTAPPSAASGAFAVLGVASLRPSTPPALTDGAHLNYVGVYVP
jgi:hypothetical protein